MMSKNSNTRSRETEGVPCLKRTLIGKQNKIHVVIRRRNISSPGPPGQLERSIDDPKLISPLVHLWQDWQHTRRSIFDRKGIVVNQPEHLDQERSRPTRSKTPSRSKSPASYRSRKSSTRNKSNSPRERSNSSRERSNSPRTRNNSPNEKGKERSPYRRKSLDRRRSSERNRRSKSLDMRKSVENYRERRSGSRERTTGSAGKKKEKYSEHKCFRKKSISPLRPGEYIPFHPDLKKRNRSREERKDNISTQIYNHISSFSVKRESRSSRESSNSPRSRSYSMRQRSNCPREKSTGRRSLLGRNSPDRRRRSSEKVRRSRSLDIRKSVENLRERRSGSREGITGNAGRKNEKDYKKTRLKNKIISPLRPGEYIQFHPDLEKHYRSREERNDNFRYSRHSRSLSRDRYKSSTSTRRSGSPHHSKSSLRQHSRSRSPRNHSYSPSRKQWKSRSPETYSEDKRAQGVKRNSRSPHARSPVKYGRRTSRSPSSRHEEHRPRSVSKGRRSRSPHPPIITFSPSRSRNHRSRLRSPNEKSKRYRESRRDYRRSRSRSPNWRTRSRSPKEQYTGFHPAFGYFEGLTGPDPFWYPGPMRPSYPAAPPRFYPPAYYPRSVQPGPIILPPRYPMMFPPVRPRIIYNNRKIKPVIQSNESESLSREPPVRVSETSAISTITESGNDSTTKGDVEKEPTKD